MLGVINVIAETPLATQIELAREADYMLLPGEEAPTEAQEASLSALAHSATATLTETVTAATSAPTQSQTSSATLSHRGLSGGAVAGVAIGAVAATLIIVGLLLLMRRNRSLRHKLERARASSKPAGSSGPSMVSPVHWNDGDGRGRDGQYLSYPSHQGHNRFSREPDPPTNPPAMAENPRPDDLAGRLSPPAQFSFNGEQYVAVPARDYQ